MSAHEARNLVQALLIKHPTAYGTSEPNVGRELRPVARELLDAQSVHQIQGGEPECTS